MTIRIFIADDHPIVWGGLRQIVSEQDDMQVVGEVASGDALLAALQQGLPDVVLCDMSMPGRSGIDLIKALKARWPNLPVLVLSVHDDDMYAVRAIKAGAMGYLSKASSSEQLLEAIRRVAAGRLYINQDVAEKLTLQAIGKAPLPHAALSDREYQVFTMLAEGLSLSVIADRLYLSVKTISTHKTNIMRKMGLTNMAQLIRYAFEHGLVSAPRTR